MDEKQISKLIKVHGFNLNREALELCVIAFGKDEKPRQTRWINKIVDTLRKQQLTSSVITGEVLRDVMTQITNGGNQTKESLFNVFDSFELPKFVYDTECRKMLPITAPREITSSVEKANEAFRNRFELVAQRARRSKNLERIRSRFHTIDSLVGVTRKVDGVVVIGMLVQQKDDCYHIEDLTGSIQADFVGSMFKPGIYCEGGIYMFEGTFDAQIFEVSNAALVPLESADDSRAFFGNENWWGGESTVAFRTNKALIKAERMNENASIVMLSDVHLDNPQVLKALYHMFAGYSSMPPVAFVFCGNFCSRPRQADTMRVLEHGFQRLANQLSEPDFREKFKETHFIFVPGPDDPSFSMFLPRPHLPVNLYKLMENVPNVKFTTNPIRLQYCSREIVILRDDLVEKMCKHAVNQIQQKDVSPWFARTVLSQAHLSPFCSHVSPVLWEWDYALALHPLPDVLVVADKFAPFLEEQAGSRVCNPGSFSKSSFRFLVYLPNLNRIDDSQISLS